MKELDSQKNLEKLFIIDALDVESVKADSLAKTNASIDSLVEAIAAETRKAGTNAKSRRELREKQKDLFMAVLLLIDDKYERIKTGLKSGFAYFIEDKSLNTIRLLSKSLGISEDSFRAVPESLKSHILNGYMDGMTFSQWLNAERDDLKSRYRRIIINAGVRGIDADEVNRQILGSARTKGMISGSGVVADMRELSNREYRTGIGARAKRDIDNMIRTFYSQIYNEVLFGTFKTNTDYISGIKHISVLDSRTTELCRRYSGAIWTLDGTPVYKNLPYLGEPPYHNNCRSIHIPVFIPSAGLRDMGVGADIAETLGGSGYDGYDFDGWLRTLSDGEVDGLFGKSFADNWRNGRVKAEEYFMRRR